MFGWILFVFFVKLFSRTWTALIILIYPILKTIAYVNWFQFRKHFSSTIIFRSNWKFQMGQRLKVCFVYVSHKITVLCIHTKMYAQPKTAITCKCKFDSIGIFCGFSDEFLICLFINLFIFLIGFLCLHGLIYWMN